MLLKNKHRPGKVASGVTDIVLQTSAVSITSTLTAPAGIQAGDLMVFIDVVAATGATDGVPGDMTQIGSALANANTQRLVISYKIAAGTESGNSYSGCSGSSGVQYRKTMLVFRGSKPISSVSVSPTVVGQLTSNNPTQKTLGASAGVPAPCLGITNFSCGGGAVDPRTTSITPTGEVANGVVQYVQYYLQNSSPADYTFDMDDELNNNGLAGVYFYNFQ